MRPSSTLFRPEALATRRPAATGEIILVAPVSFAALAGGAFTLACLILAALLRGDYTRHSTLSGRLVPDLGLIEVAAPQSGTIVEKRVAEGDLVERGDVLFAVSSERISRMRGATHELISRELDERRDSLAVQIDKTRELERADRSSIEARLAALDVELEQLLESLADQVRRVALAEQTAARYRRLRDEGFVADEPLAARQEALLDQRARRASLERESGRLERERAELAGQLAALPVRYASQIAELERSIAALELEAAENEARRLIVVAAPARGAVAAIVAELGQVVEGGRTLLSIVPAGAKLEARLYAPSHAVGFIDAGDEVLLRYPAFPYQKFGHRRGTVTAISRAALPSAAAPGGAAGAAGEPLYRVVVELGAQVLEIHGEQRALRAGMAVEADIRLETRRLYEWVLEPLFGMARRR